MKEEELMIGDWVIYDNEPHQIQEIIYGGVTIECWPKIISEIKPIPITNEILVKNGFDEQWHDMSSLIIFNSSNDEVSTVKYNYHSSTISISVRPFRLVNKRNEREQTIEAIGCMYVHELQHALRLCGIDKKIKLNEEK